MNKPAITEDMVKEVEALRDLMSIKEDLHPELQAFYSSVESFNVVKHPLVFAVPYNEMLNAMLNKQLESKKAALTTALTEDNIHRVVFLHERPFRVNAFDTYHLKLTSGRDYWELLHNIWTDSENIMESVDIWRRLLSSRVIDKQFFMSSGETRFLQHQLPNIIPIYRGTRAEEMESGDIGMSWTTSLKTAKFFAQRFHKEGIVLGGRVHKANVFAYSKARGEKEIIVLDSNDIITIETIGDKA